MKFRQVSPEVFVATDGVVAIDRGDLAALRAQALTNPSRKARICAHPSVGDALHEMVIVHMSGAYVRPHKHPRKSESFHMIEGRLDIVLFDDVGQVDRVIALAADGPGSLFYRLSECRFHTVVPRSDVVVFHEVTNGPFDRSETVFAAWAPDESDVSGIAQFASDLEERVSAVRVRTS